MLRAATMRRLAARLERLVPGMGKRVPTRPMGGGGGADTSTLYGRMMATAPVTTSATAAGILWFSGDALAQASCLHARFAHTPRRLRSVAHAGGMRFILLQWSERREHPDKPLEINRLAGTVLDGTLVGGVGGYFW
jgi:hypothetical protein